jgi:hypothetical protein
LARVFQESSDAKRRRGGLEQLPRRLAILFLDVAYATSTLWLWSKQSVPLCL